MMELGEAIREQARSHFGFSALTNPLWERACSRMERLGPSVEPINVHP
jgi:hypothetical protein